MKVHTFVVGCGTVGFCLLTVLWNVPGCGTDDFLDLEDYQRDLLVGGVTALWLADQDGEAPPERPLPQDGVSCWDVNGNGEKDAEEDANGDGVFDALDCRGAPGSAGQDGTEGLNCWDLDSNGIGDPPEDVNGDGVFDASDCRGPEGPPGAGGARGSPGASGPPGEDGLEFFDIFIDDFFAGDGTSSGVLQLVTVRIDEPALGNVNSNAGVRDAVAYRVAIPPAYGPANDVTMRLFLHRTGAVLDECFIFTVDARRLRDGTGAEVYDRPLPHSLDECNASPSTPGCGRRWVRIISGEDDGGDVLLVVDLPINNESPVDGLTYPNDLSGGDLLTFELGTYRSDGRTYQILGVEFIESPPDSALLRRAVVFATEDQVSCGEDCNDNGLSDAVDIASCPADDPSCQDCNDNAVPDECDLCDDDALLGVMARTGGLPFTYLQDGFAQELYATAPGFMGGVAFAPDGDVLVNRCPATRDGSALRRFDAQTTVVIHGSIVHPLIAVLPSNAGCGMTNHPDGTLYSNTDLGVTNLDPDTGVELRAPFGPEGNSLGIAVDPQTGDLVYVGADGTLFVVDPALTTSSVFSSVAAGTFIDGIGLDPTGEFLFLANRDDSALTILRRDGTFVQRIAIFHDGSAHEPDDVAFHEVAPQFVVTNNLDGTLTRFDFPNNDFTQTPTQSMLADGGFRGDLLQVGSDTCLYLTQDGTRFADGTESDDNSVVRICAGFEPPAPTRINLMPEHAVSFVGTQHTITASVTTEDEEPLKDVAVTFEILPGGPNRGVGASIVTGVDGTASFTYTGDGGPGVDRIQAWFEGKDGVLNSNVVTKTWLPTDCSPDCNDNGVPDECDIAGGTSFDCQPDGIPDECGGGCVGCLTDTDCNGGDPCTVDTCAQGECVTEPVACPEGYVCVEGECVE